MKISIIIPVYNSEMNIEKCIQSVINQTYTNLEIILVNDGSTDNSESICKKYKKIDSRIKYISIENSGVAFARNIGLINATGDYIGFVDSDDYIEPDMYNYLIQNMTDRKADLSICSYFKEKLDGNNVNKTKSNSYLKNRIDYPFIIFFDLNVQGYLWNKIYSRKLLFDSKNNLKVFFESDIFNLSDDLFNFRVFERNKKIVICYGNSKMYHYVQRNNSITYQKYSLKKLSGLIVRLREIEILDKNNIDSDFLKIDYCCLFILNKVLIKKYNINPDNNYYELERKFNELIKQISFFNLNSKLKLKYIVIRFCPFIYKFKTLFLNSKI